MDECSCNYLFRRQEPGKHNVDEAKARGQVCVWAEGRELAFRQEVAGDTPAQVAAFIHERAALANGYQPSVSGYLQEGLGRREATHT